MVWREASNVLAAASREPVDAHEFHSSVPGGDMSWQVSVFVTGESRDAHFSWPTEMSPGQTVSASALLDPPLGRNRPPIPLPP